MQNNSEKFYDTYGKNASFEAFDQLETTVRDAVKPLETTFGYKVKKYLALTLFAVLITGIVLAGSIFVVIFLAVLLVDAIIRTIFFKNSSSSFLIIKK